MILREVSNLNSNGIHTMTAPHTVGPAGLLSDALTEASPDLPRQFWRLIATGVTTVEVSLAVGVPEIVELDR